MLPPVVVREAWNESSMPKAKKKVPLEYIIRLEFSVVAMVTGSW